jgi:protein O-mannosyl-transferase
MKRSPNIEQSSTPYFTEPSTRSLYWLMLVLVAAVTLSVFSVVRHAEFVPWDDEINIYGNPHIQGITAKSVRWMFTDTSYVHRYMPIGWLSLAIDYDLAHGFNPATYHIGNLLLHTINAVLVFLLLGDLLRRATANKPVSARALTIASAVGALFWAIHPLRAETVAWSSARLYQVAVLFMLASVFAYLKFSDQPERRTFYWVSVTAFFLSLLTYPLTLGFVGAIVALDIFPLRKLTLTKAAIFSPPARKVWIQKLPFMAAALFTLTATLWNRVHATKFAAPASLDDFGWLSRAAQAFYVWGCYLWKTWWPAGLCPTYKTLLDFHWWEPRFVCSFLLVAGVTLTVLRKSRQWPAALALWIAYLALLFPLLGLTEHPHYPYDRYSVIVGMLWSLVVGWIVLQMWENKRGRLVALTCSGTLLAVFGFLSLQQAALWNNATTLLPNIIAELGEHPARGQQEVVLGVTYMARRDNAKAEACFRNALRVKPRYTPAHVALGDVLSEAGKFDEAISHYQSALQIEPENLKARQNLGIAFGSVGKVNEAVAEFQAAVEINAQSADAHHNLAVALAQQGRKEDAKLHLAESRRLREQKRL